MQQIPDAHNDATPAASTPATTEDVAALTLETAPLITRTIRTQMRAGRGDDLSTPQFRALGYVGRHPGASLSRVAEHLGLSTPATSRLIDALVTRGEVERAPDPEDRRYITLRLSAQGEARYLQTRQRALAHLGALLEGLTPAERDVVARALPILRALFTAEAPTPPS